MLELKWWWRFNVKFRILILNRLNLPFSVAKKYLVRFQFEEINLGGENVNKMLIFDYFD